MKPKLDTSLARVYISDTRASQILERVRYWEREYRRLYRSATSPASWWSDARIARQWDRAEQAANHVVDLVKLYRDVLEYAIAEER